MKRPVLKDRTLVLIFALYGLAVAATSGYLGYRYGTPCVCIFAKMGGGTIN